LIDGAGHHEFLEHERDDRRHESDADERDGDAVEIDAAGAHRGQLRLA
jgi:hypothetical protein